MFGSILEVILEPKREPKSRDEAFCVTKGGQMRLMKRRLISGIAQRRTRKGGVRPPPLWDKRAGH